MRDLALLHTFMEFLHVTGALTVPPEDLFAAANVVAEQFALAEAGGPGHIELQRTIAAIEEMKQQQGVQSNAE